MELVEALSLPDGPERTTAIVAWIQSLFTESAQVPVLVGGGAVEIFTGGAYTTGDLDFVGSVPKAIGTILENNGFDKEWSLSDPDDEVLEEWANRGPATVDE